VSARGEIVEVWRAAGASDATIDLWLGSPHPHLTYYSPRQALGLFPRDVAVEQLVLAIARSDAQDLEQVAAEPGHGASAAAHIDAGNSGEPSTCETQA
jgi:hypothetical protein